MATTVAVLEAKLRADTRDFDKDMKKSEGKMSKFAGAAKLGAVAAGAGIAYGLGKVAKIGWDEFNSGQKEAAQTNAVLKSTGGVAKVTAKHVQSLGTQIMRKTGIDDEAIVSGENLLLTFTGIRNEAGKNNKIFDQATRLTADLSTAMGQDMKTSAIQVGKALNDPFRGYTRLQRIGVTFDKTQEKQIKQFEKTGNKMGAQKVILEELRKEFGGSAEAAGKTFGGQIKILQERFANFSGELVAKAIPYLKRLFVWFNDKIVPVIKNVAEEIMPLLRTAVGSIGDAIRENEPQLREIWENISTAVKKMWKVVGPLLKFLFEEVVPRAITIAVTYVSTYIKAIAKIITTAVRVVNWFKGTFVTFWKNVWQRVTDLLFNARMKMLDLFLGWAERMLRIADKGFGWLPGLGPKIDKAIKKITEMREAAELASRRRYAIRFVSNAARVKSDIEDMTARARSASGDFGTNAIGATSLVSLGRQLQSMGFSVGEHPQFGGVGGGHVPGSYHYQGRALDINWPGGGEGAKLDWLYSRLRRMPGVKELLWRTAGHFDHLHLAMDRGGVVPGRRGAPVPVLAHGGETFIPTHRSGGAMVANVYLDGRQIASAVFDPLRNAAASYKRTNGRPAF